jgi:hypothetical protein
MHDRDLVHRFERVDELDHDVDRLQQVERSLLHHLAQRRPFEQLHDAGDPQRGLGLDEVEDVDDVRMTDRVDDPGLVEEARDVLGVRRVRALEDFDRGAPTEPHVRRGVHAAHAAVADHLIEAIAAQNFAQLRGQRFVGGMRWP